MLAKPRGRGLESLPVSWDNEQMRALFLVLLLSGCVSLSSFSDGMTALKGQPVEVAFQKLGYPERQAVIAGRTVYYWGDRTDCSFKIVATADGRVDRWDGIGSPAACSIYVSDLRK